MMRKIIMLAIFTAAAAPAIAETMEAAPSKPHCTLPDPKACPDWGSRYTPRPASVKPEFVKPENAPNLGRGVMKPDPVKPHVVKPDPTDQDGHAKPTKEH